MDARRFEGKVAVVTGAAQGIGEAVARRLACEGAAVLLADRQAERAARVAAEIGRTGRAAVVEVEMSREDCGEAIAAAAVSHFGRIDQAVLCAGITAMKDWREITAQEWDRMLTVNLRGSLLCLQALSRRMIEQGSGGAIVTLGATSGHGPRPDAAHYGASKAGIIHLTRSAALGLARHGIRVNAISPGIVRTDMWRGVTEARAALQGNTPEEYERAALARVPLGRAAGPEEIASLAAFLLSDEAAYITGQVILQDGGYSLVVA